MHLLAASLLWSATGTGLIIAGGVWLCLSHAHLVLIAVSVALGLLKARFILCRSAQKVATRIEQRGDGRCIGGFLSWRTWLVVVAMALLGRLVRASPLPVSIRGALYVAIGVALLAASRLLWVRWHALRPVPGSQGSDM